jgi:hypothetical protein
LKAERWQLVYLLIILIGLLIGYWIHPLVAVGFIWVAIIAAELIG